MDDEHDSLIKNQTYIRRFKFEICDGDPCVFVRRINNKLTIIAIYVDDGLVLAEDMEEIELVISYMQEHFDITEWFKFIKKHMSRKY